MKYKYSRKEIAIFIMDNNLTQSGLISRLTEPLEIKPKKAIKKKKIKKLNFEFPSQTLHSIKIGTNLYELWTKQCQIIDYINNEKL